MFNEIMVNPSGNNDGNNVPNTAEWVEIYNLCDEPVDVSCYALTDGDFSLTFPQGTIIQGNSYFVIGSSNSGTTVDLNWATCNCTTNTNSQVGILTNTGEQLILVNETGALINGIYWGSGQFPVNLLSLALPGCPSQEITFNAPGIFFETIPVASGEDCSISRLCDGEWAETCGNSATPGAVNGTELVVVDFDYPEGEICAGACLSFEDLSQGATGWEWTFFGASTLTSTVENPSGICYDSPGFYGVELQITSNCGPATIFYQNIIEVLPSAIPVISPAGTIVLCEDDGTVLSSTGTGNFQWFLNGSAIPGATSNEWTPLSDGSYTVTLTNGICETISDPVDVTVVSAESVVIEPASAVSICEGESVLLSLLDTYDSYQWLQNGIAINGAISPEYLCTDSGDYAVEVISGACSSASNAVTVSVVAIPEPLIAPQGPLEFCADNIGTLSTGTAFDSYQWYFNNSPIPASNGNSLSPQSGGNYFVEVTSDGCTGLSAETNVVINDVANPIIEPGEDVTTCSPSAILEAQSTGSIQWYYNGQAVPGETQATLNATQDGTYYFSAMIHPSCPKTSDQIEVSLNVPLELEVMASADTACNGEIVQITASGSYTEIIWNNSSTEDTLFVSSSGLYVATVSDNFCVAVDSAEVFFAEFPIAIAPPHFASPCTDLIQLSGTATGEVTWLMNNTIIAEGAEVTIPAPGRDTEYVLSATIGNCVATDTVRVGVDCTFIYAPAAFTPDGDGLNDEFRVIVSGVSSYKLRIFDRWGSVVFETEDPEAVWTGGVDEYYVADGIYVWRIDALNEQNLELLDKSKRTGTVLVIR